MTLGQLMSCEDLGGADEHTADIPDEDEKEDQDEPYFHVMGYPPHVMNTVARARGGEGHTPGITLMPHLGDSQGCVKPGVGPTLVL